VQIQTAEPGRHGADGTGGRPLAVDAHGRVHGVEGLRVVDASIMPTSVANNTNLTCLMLGERLASWMVKEP
jgi:choline dehydrogenase